MEHFGFKSGYAVYNVGCKAFKTGLLCSDNNCCLKQLCTAVKMFSVDFLKFRHPNYSAPLRALIAIYSKV